MKYINNKYPKKKLHKIDFISISLTCCNWKSISIAFSLNFDLLSVFHYFFCTFLLLKTFHIILWEFDY